MKYSQVSGNKSSTFLDYKLLIQIAAEFKNSLIPEQTLIKVYVFYLISTCWF